MLFDTDIGRKMANYGTIFANNEFFGINSYIGLRNVPENNLLNEYLHSNRNKLFNVSDFQNIESITNDITYYIDKSKIKFDYQLI